MTNSLSTASLPLAMENMPTPPENALVVTKKDPIRTAQNGQTYRRKPAAGDCGINSRSLPRATCPICPVHGGGRDFTCLKDLVRTGCGHTHGDKHNESQDLVRTGCGHTHGDKHNESQ
eukprot:TRINITY_DN17936_c0_g1_i2.p1 TRINITY_DN17936_c0_g1~~TRINITY_DN17936_c0_g1_i2.p1  ORF type:complete len:118 (-),score=15.02 TRINITY_DN17936_c0_g1_i2:344-697(-)